MGSGLLDGVRSRPIYRWASAALGVIAALYFINYSIEYWASLPYLTWDVKTYAVILIAVMGYGITLLLGSFAWYLLLRAADEKPRFLHVLVIHLISQFAKYIPGNVAHHIGRVALARSYGLKASQIIFTMTLEAVWVILTAIILGLILITATGSSVLEGVSKIPPMWVFALGSATAALILFAGVWLMGRLHLEPISKIFKDIRNKLPQLSVFLMCVAIYSINFFLMGIILDLLALELFGVPDSRFWHLTGVFAFAWVAGFIVPGAPGGLGVREAILVTALSPYYGGGIAVGVTLLVRGVTIIGDGLGFLVGLMVRSFLNRR